MAQSTRNTEVHFLELTSKSATRAFGEFCLSTEIAHDYTRDSSFCFGHWACVVTVKLYSGDESTPVPVEKLESPRQVT